MEFQHILETEIPTFAAFAHRCCGLGNRSYPLLPTPEAIDEEMRRCIRAENRGLLGAYENGVPMGVMGYFSIPEDRYLQTTLFYTTGHGTALEGFLATLEETYPGYEVYIGVEQGYRLAEEVLSRQGYRLLDDLQDTFLDMSRAVPTAPGQPDGRRIGEAEWEDACAFHEKTFGSGAGYWTGDKIRSSPGDWDIYAVYSGSEIASAIYLRRSENNEVCEVFASHVRQPSHGESLLETAARDLKARYPWCKRLVMMLEAEERPLLDAAEKMGFQYNGRYRCWTKTT